MLYTWHMSENTSHLQSAADKVVFEISRLLKRKNPILVALDGRSGTGKSTIAQAIASRVEGIILVADDFYSGGNDDAWSGFSTQEKVEKGIDWQRMRAQVLEPLLAKKPASWHPLDFKPESGWIGWKDETVKREPAPVVLLDGVYSARPELSDLVDFAVLVEAADEVRRKRLVIREGQGFMERWHKLWDCAEEYYFTQICPRSSFDLVVRNDERSIARSPAQAPDAPLTPDRCPEEDQPVVCDERPKTKRFVSFKQQVP